MRGQESVTPFNNAAAGTSADFTLQGGNYLLVLGATGSGGTAVLSIKTLDGSYIALLGRETAITAAGYMHYDGLPPGTYKLVIATLTANTATITRVPTE